MPERAGAAPTFSLLTNPFALLDAPQDASLADLAACADRAGTPEAAAAARALSVPRSRLAAEVAFLPGVAAPAVAALLAALRDARRPDGIAALPPTAEANLHAHLCAAGQTASATALVRLAPEPSEALAAVLDARRAAAGLPRVPPAALAQERATLADRHAAALVDAVLAAGDPAATLSALIVDAPHDAAALLRKAAAAWTRRSATSLARLQDAAGAAVVVAGRDPATAAAAVAAIRAWAAYSRPQRLMDARAASDHRPTLAAIRPWRSAAARLATTSLAGGVALAEALASCCADLPGEGPVLRDEVQALHAHAEEQTLAPLLAELRLCAERLAAAPQPLCAVLARRRFAADLRRGEAAELWTRFDAACAASTLSEAPWVTVRTLVLALVGKDAGMPAARTALSLQRGMAARAAAAGRTDLAARVAAGIRVLEAGVALAAYRRVSRRRWVLWWAVPWRNWRILRAIRQALSLVDDPDDRAALQHHDSGLRRGIRNRRIAVASLAAVGAVVAGINALDSDYASHAPYRRLPPQALRMQP